MKYDNPPREGELSGASRSPIDLSSKAYRLAGPESIPSAITSIAIATTDPIIEILADYQPEWKRHPDATIVVTTNQVDEPRLLCLSGPEMMMPDERRDSGPFRLEGYREHVRPSSEDPESNEERDLDDEPRRRDQGTRRVNLLVRQDPGEAPEKGNKRGGDPRHRTDRATPRSRASRIKRLLVVAGIVLMCGALGAAGYCYLCRPRSVRRLPSS